MKIAGIICEYNPLHLGHRKQLQLLRAQLGADCGIVCLMSGNYVQRGAPAVLDKSCRAEAAVRSGADLVLELPVTYALSSAEGFAAGGVKILSQLCDYLSFGAESGSAESLLETAKLLLSPEFPEQLHRQLEKGASFPVARQAALEAMGADSSALLQPNDILAVEYCKAILAQNTKMIPLPHLRQGCYHDTAIDPENPSATALRQAMADGGDWLCYVPEEARSVLENASMHTLAAGEKAILARLRTMTDAEFEALPFGSEGLWRKLMHASRRESTLAQILAATKSKRYTHTRLQRMILCAFLGITEEMMSAPVPYVRVLAFNHRGREILNQVKERGFFRNAGEPMPSPWEELEQRCDSLYGLFSDTPESPDAAAKRRVRYLREDPHAI